MTQHTTAKTWRQRYSSFTAAVVAASSLLYSCGDSGSNFTAPQVEQNSSTATNIAGHTWNVAAAVAAHLNDVGVEAKPDVQLTQLSKALREDTGTVTRGKEIKLRLRRNPAGVMVSTDLGTELATYCVEPIDTTWTVSNCAAQPVNSPVRATVTAEGSVERLVAAVNILAGRNKQQADIELIGTALDVLGNDQLDGFGAQITWTGPDLKGKVRITSGDTSACATLVDGVFAATAC